MLRRIYRRWGYYITILSLPFFKVKLLRFTKDNRLSIQRHKFRNELWVIFGSGCIAYTPYQKKKNPRIFFVKKNRMHSFESINRVSILEFQFGRKVIESDIKRYNKKHKKTWK